MKKALFILLIVFLTLPLGVKAQFDTQLSQYWSAINYYNPGYAGQSTKMGITALARLQWVGVENAPKTTLILAEMPLTFLGREHGVGVNMYNDRAGFFSTSVMSGQYSYKTKLFGGNLGVGIQVGYINESFEADTIRLPDQNSSNTIGKLSGTSIDAGLGIYFSKNKFYTGLSVTHLFTDSYELGDNYVREVPRAYYFTAGYNIPLNNSLIELHPSILLKTVEPSSWTIEGDSLVPVVKGNFMKALWTQAQLDVSLRMSYKKMFWVGASWRGVTWDRRDAVVAMLGIRLKGFDLGYSFDYPLNAFRHDSWGSHELSLRYAVDMSKKKKKSNKHKSVRIL